MASTLKVKMSDEVSKHLKCLASDMETHKSLLSQLESFVSKDCVTRREIVTLSDTVSAYTEINDIEVRVARTLKALYLAANVTEAQAESSSHLVKPSVVDNILETSLLYFFKYPYDENYDCEFLIFEKIQNFKK